MNSAILIERAIFAPEKDQRSNPPVAEKTQDPSQQNRVVAHFQTVSAAHSNTASESASAGGPSSV